MLPVVFPIVSLLAGIPIGLLLKSHTERKLRGNPTPWLPFGRSSLPMIFLGIGVKMVLVLPIFFAPLYLVSELGRRLELSHEQGMIQFLYLVGILIGKGIRYGYWRRQDVWAQS
jgi:hypothetical protein